MTPGGFLYEGEVRHHRTAPVPHAFRYRLFMPYVDVDRLVETFRGRWFWSATRPSLAWFRRADYLGPADRPLGECVRDLVAERIGRRPTGPVRLLTHFRYFGIAMNPLSLYYCFNADERLDAVVAEVSNTPWNERHWYVLDARQSDATSLRAEASKAFHVSPFLGMDYDYVFTWNAPSERLRLQIVNRDSGRSESRPIFEAVLDMRRRPLDGWGLASVLVRYPWMTLRVLAGIYYQALRLWWKGTPYFPHPASQPSPNTSAEVRLGGESAAAESVDGSLVSSREN